MVKVGDKVKIKAVRNGGGLVKVNDVVTVTEMGCVYGFIAVTSSGEEIYVCYDFDNSCADYLVGDIVMPETKTEAERRGAKFGVTGALKRCGTRIVFHSIREDAFKFESNEEIWAVMPENTCSVLAFNASEIRLDHEPEFIAWSEAPEELKYDASRVYYRGEPVKWIAKPEGALADVVYVIRDGNIQLLTGCLTVKL